jgi:hypothetical protein
MKKLLVIVLLVFSGAAMATPIYSENFDGYAADVNPAGWVDAYASMQTRLFGTNMVYGQTGTVGYVGLSYVDGVVTGNNYTIDAVLYKNAGAVVGVVGGLDDSTGISTADYYKFSWSTGAVKPKFEKVINGVATTLGWGAAGIDWNWGYRLWRLDVEGNTITASIYNKINTAGTWEQSNLVLLSQTILTDSDPLAGKAGVCTAFMTSSATHAAVDEFTIIPEPATICLLTIGSLLVIRRKK